MMCPLNRKLRFPSCTRKNLSPVPPQPLGDWFWVVLFLVVSRLLLELYFLSFIRYESHECYWTLFRVSFFKVPFILSIRGGMPPEIFLPDLVIFYIAYYFFVVAAAFGWFVIVGTARVVEKFRNCRTTTSLSIKVSTQPLGKDPYYLTYDKMS